MTHGRVRRLNAEEVGKLASEALATGYPNQVGWGCARFIVQASGEEGGQRRGFVFVGGLLLSVTADGGLPWLRDRGPRQDLAQIYQVLDEQGRASGLEDSARTCTARP